MWYERVPSKPGGSSLEFGPFSLSPEQIGVGFMSNLIVFPPTFLIILLFRKSRLRTLRPSRITEALKKQRIHLNQMHSKSGNSFDKKDSNDDGLKLTETNQRKSKMIKNKISIAYVPMGQTTGKN